MRQASAWRCAEHSKAGAGCVSPLMRDARLACRGVEMALRRQRLLVASALLAVLLASPAWADDGLTLEERLLAVFRATEPPSAITVSRLQHRQAEELAEVLRRVAPSDVRVVADSATNSLIIAGPGSCACSAGRTGGRRRPCSVTR